MTEQPDGNCWFRVDLSSRQCNRTARPGDLFCFEKTHRSTEISLDDLKKAIKKDDVTFTEEFWNSHHQKNLKDVLLERNTPLTLAVQSKSHKVVKWLITVAKVDVNQSTKSLRLPITPLDFPVERNDFLAV
jgi:hypothetical protein